MRRGGYPSALFLLAKQKKKSELVSMGAGVISETTEKPIWQEIVFSVVSDSCFIYDISPGPEGDYNMNYF